MVTVVLSTTGPQGLALTGMPATAGPGCGPGEVATPAWSTGLPLNVFGSGATAACAAATGLAVDKLRTFCRSSAFSFSILSSRAITSSRVAARAAPPNETRQSAAQAVPERNLFLMTFPRYVAIQLASEAGSVVDTKRRMKGLGGQFGKKWQSVAKMVQ
jgi:hypothetical protein